MKLHPIKGVLFLFFVNLTQVIFSQNTTLQLSPEEISDRISTVYGADFVLNNPTLVTALGKVLNERIEFEYIQQEETEKFPLLSSVPINTKVNPNLQGIYYTSFNLSSFNPLMYNLEFFSDRTQIFRIDGTGYLMIVKPIQRN